MPILNEEYMPHLIRGMIDGDGWISYKTHSVGFCGNEKCVTQLRDYLCVILNVYNVKVIKHRNIYMVNWASRKDVKNICEYLYQNKKDCYIERKYQNYLNIIDVNTEVN